MEHNLYRAVEALGRCSPERDRAAASAGLAGAYGLPSETVQLRAARKALGLCRSEREAREWDEASDSEWDSDDSEWDSRWDAASDSMDSDDSIWNSEWDEASDSDESWRVMRRRIIARWTATNNRRRSSAGPTTRAGAASAGPTTRAGATSAGPTTRTRAARSKGDKGSTRTTTWTSTRRSTWTVPGRTAQDLHRRSVAHRESEAAASAGPTTRAGATSAGPTTCAGAAGSKGDKDSPDDWANGGKGGRCDIWHEAVISEKW